ncbi:pseudouridine synthase [Litorivivens sp.]|uniref:pseudouridine synthase n=1 Tax=Litorivivens sp. TaxID=2020868 RepID=UPI00356A155E
MTSSSTRLDRYISKNSPYSKSDVRLLIAQQRILVGGKPAESIRQLIDKFSRVELDGVCLQQKRPVYIMLNKPKGVVSATRDGTHTTVVDLIDHPEKHDLHIAGRLDFNTTGLILLTNDGLWSRRLSLPESKLAKTYQVTVAKPLNADYVAAFFRGIYFAYEDITTQPAKLEIVSPHEARLTLVEGKYHQVKRMFGHFQNEVLSLHRVSVGPIALRELEPGQCRELSEAEIRETGGLVA